MAAPMRDSPLDGGHRAKVADPRTAAAAKAEPAASNFEYDDNEWDIGIGDLIIDLDADIEKTNEKSGGVGAGGSTANSGMSSATSGTGNKTGKMAVEHSATVDKGLKMKIKRTKPGTKTSEAKHEIVKPGEQNGGEVGVGDGSKGKHPPPSSVSGAGISGGSGGNGSSGNASAGSGNSSSSSSSGSGSNGATSSGSTSSSKRGSSGHRRDKARDKYGGTSDKTVAKSAPSPAPSPANPDVNGVVRPPVSASVTSVQQQPPQQSSAPPQAPPPPPQQQRVVFPVSSGPGPPAPITANAPGPPSVAATAPVATTKPEPPKVMASTTAVGPVEENHSTSPPPPKKIKTSTEPKDMLDVCVGTSVGTITEPDCLGPCEPGTSVTLEGIVWHETEGGVLVVNVTWRGKTYVGTLLDCTRHDWAPPRFCDSPTSDLDARMPKGRGKRGRAAASTNPGGDLSNFTETRSSVHSKLRNGGAKGRRGGAGSASSSGSTAGTGSPTPFAPPRPESNSKRKARAPDEEPLGSGKKSRSTPASGNSSPPPSPVLLECPEPNCSKKYKHINGLKYHQSHAHGSAEDEDTKDAASLSENDESNAEVPSPALSVKSPEKLSDQQQQQQTPSSTPQQQQSQQQQQQRKEEVTNQSPLPTPPTVIPVTPQPTPSVVTEQQGQPVLNKSGLVPSPTPQMPQGVPSQVAPPPPELVPATVTPLLSPDTKNVVKPGVLRFVPPVEDFSVGVFCSNKQVLPTPPVVSSSTPVSTIRAVSVAVAPSQPQSLPISQPQSIPQSQSQPQAQVSSLQQPQAQPQPLPLPQSQIPLANKPPPPQFKVKPTASLMPDDKKKLQGHKKKNRKSPAGSPHPQPEQQSFGIDASGREDVQSPAYSDISDDTAPVLESEVGDGKNKGQSGDKKGEIGQGPSPHAMPHYGMYPFYGQAPYLVQSVQQDGKPKEPNDKLIENKSIEKDKKEGASGGEYQQKLLQPHYYPYGYMPSYPYNLEPSYPVAVMPSEDKGKEPLGKDDKSPSPSEHAKPIPAAPSPIQVPNPAKVKGEPGPGMKDKHQNENHQILKESIEMKNQMNPYLYSRQQQQQQQQQQQPPPQQQQQQQQQQQDEMRRYYLYPEQQRRKEPQGQPEQSPKPTPPPPPKPAALPSPSHKHKEKAPEEKKEDKVKQEGVKPTMETQGPPPPPTSSYAYIHPSYMQSPYHGGLPFDPGHPMYRSINPMLVPGYGSNPYLHPQIPRYHAPEDLSRPPSGPTKALDLLQHHANQYYSTHKIHELQERALKSPTPKTGGSSASPSGAGGPPVGSAPGQGVSQGPPVSAAGGVPGGPPPPGKQVAGDGKETRSPPPQRHVHTHHHTHVGLGYPILAGQYPAPYGAVLASQQAAAVAATVINPYPPK